MFTPSHYRQALSEIALMLDEPALRGSVLRELEQCPYIMRVVEKISSSELAQ